MDIHDLLANQQTRRGNRMARLAGALKVRKPQRPVAWVLATVVAINHASLLAQTGAVDQFDNVRLISNVAERRQETDASLTLEVDRLVVRSRAGGSDLKVFSYSSIRRAEYSYSTGRRWRAGVAAVAVFGFFQFPFVGLPVFLLKGKKHWLTVSSEKDVALLRLDKNSHKIIVSALEGRSGVKVETVGEKK